MVQESQLSVSHTRAREDGLPYRVLPAPSEFTKSDTIPIEPKSPPSSTTTSVANRRGRIVLEKISSTNNEPVSVVLTTGSEPCGGRQSEGKQPEVKEHLASSENKSSVSHDSVASEAYGSQGKKSKAFPIPGRRHKLVWPEIPVSFEQWTTEDYQKRFKFVVDHLKAIVDHHPELRSRARFIDYDLMMVGNTEQDAIPSILIGCKKSDQRALKGHIDKSARSRLVCTADSRLPGFLQERQLSGTISQAPLKLVYYPSAINPTRLLASEETLPLNSASTRTMCGASVVYEGRSATVGLTLDIDGTNRLLTVDHLFWQNHTEQENLDVTGVDFNGISDEVSSVNDAGYLWDIDSESDEDDDLSDEECPDSGDELGTYDEDGFHEGEHRGRNPSQEGLHVLSTSIGEGEAYVMVPAPNTGDQQLHNVNESSPLSIPQMVDRIKHTSIPSRLRPFLDWSCLALNEDHSGSRRCNYISVEECIDPVLLHSIATTPRCQKTHVYMISGRLGVRRGLLLDRFSYIGSSPGRDMAKVWTVILDSSGVIRGECGSIIVDEETFEVYGHVIGSDARGFARIAPLVDVVDQIKVDFKAGYVQLPKESTICSQSLLTDDKLSSVNIEILANVEPFPRCSSNGWFCDDEPGLSCLCTYSFSSPCLTLNRPLLCRLADDCYHQVKGFCMTVAAYTEEDELNIVRRWRGVFERRPPPEPLQSSPADQMVNTTIQPTVHDGDSVNHWRFDCERNDERANARKRSNGMGGDQFEQSSSTSPATPKANRLLVELWADLGHKTVRIAYQRLPNVGMLLKKSLQIPFPSPSELPGLTDCNAYTAGLSWDANIAAVGTATVGVLGTAFLASSFLLPPTYPITVSACSFWLGKRLIQPYLQQVQSTTMTRVKSNEDTAQEAPISSSGALSRFTARLFYHTVQKSALRRASQPDRRIESTDEPASQFYWGS